jgi:hypothetical protein
MFSLENLFPFENLCSYFSDFQDATKDWSRLQSLTSMLLCTPLRCYRLVMQLVYTFVHKLQPMYIYDALK